VSSPGRRPELVGLRLADAGERWAALGFQVNGGSEMWLGGVSIQLGAPGRGIGGWRLDGVDPVESIDGLDTEVGDRPAGGEALPHPNGAVGLDHVVAITPRFDRTAAELAEAGLELRRIRQAPDGFRQGFRRLGPVILEVVEALGEPDGPARFWGLVVNVADLDGLAARLGNHLGQVKPAVQPGRRIATLRESAGLGQAVAFMSLEGS
jgi:hypothetical protein